MSDCCRKPKNPCMVCGRTVTAKSGLQCQGSCKSWIHFTCCSYTPGKIKDIKAKVIKVRCPCPECVTQGPKELIMKKSSFACINKICPVNNPPACTKPECILNKMSQQTSTCGPPPPKEWPGLPCSGHNCKNNMQEDQSSRRGHPIPPMPSPTSPGANSSCPPSLSPTPPRHGSPTATPVMPSISLVENMCETVGLLSDQLNQLMTKMTDVLSPTGQTGKSGAGMQHGSGCRCPKNPKR